MRIKKALALVVSAAVTISTLAGCSQAAQNYGEELSKVSKWDSYTTESSGTYTMSNGGTSQTFKFTSTSYSSDNKAYSEVKYNSADSDAQVLDMKSYFDGSSYYINKSYFEDMYKLSGKEVPEKLKKLNAEYIGLDIGANMDAIKTLMSNPKEYIKIAETLFGENSIDLPYVQNGREYELNLDSEKVAQLQSLLIKNVLSKSGEKNAQNGALNEEQEKAVDSLKDLYSGSSISTKESFEDDKYTVDMNFDLKVKDVSEVNMNMNSVSNKCDKKEITIPSNSVKFTQEEYVNLLADENASTDK